VLILIELTVFGFFILFIVLRIYTF
jgi:hypothetical protein